MPDFDFQITHASVCNGWPHQACRKAIFLSTRTWRTGMPVHDAYAALRAVWRKRVGVLAGEQWELLTGPMAGRSIQYARNCPPFGVLARVKAKPCKRNRVCPFCYARDVVFEWYKSVQWLTGHFPDAAAKLKILGVRSRYLKIPLAEFDWPTWHTVLRDRLFADPKAFQAGTVFGSRFRVVMSPSVAQDCVDVQVSSLLMVAAESPVPVMASLLGSRPATRTEVRSAEPDNSRSVSDLFAWLLAYPPGLLLGPVAVMTEILRETAKLKLSVSAGILDTDSIRMTLRKLNDRKTGRMKLISNTFRCSVMVAARTKENRGSIGKKASSISGVMAASWKSSVFVQVSVTCLRGSEATCLPPPPPNSPLGEVPPLIE